MRNNRPDLYDDINNTVHKIASTLKKYWFDVMAGDSTHLLYFDLIYI